MTSWSSIELEILNAISAGILVDRRNRMPHGKGKWRLRLPEDIIGQCIHQSAGSNTDDPIETAIYHTEPNHISENGLPGICYSICIPDTEEPPWLTSDFSCITYAQGADDKKYPGDENRHLIPILVMGSFVAPGYRGKKMKPSARQMHSLAKVTDWLGELFGYSTEGIFGHFHFGKPQCPGSAVSEWIESLRLVGRQLQHTEDWQKALCTVLKDALPVYGIDGKWGNESKRALVTFQRKYKMRVTGVQDAFTELMLMRAAKEKSFENT